MSRWRPGDGWHCNHNISPRQVSPKFRSVEERYPKGQYPDRRERLLILMNQLLKRRILNLLSEDYPVKVVVVVVFSSLYSVKEGEVDGSRII